MSCHEPSLPLVPPLMLTCTCSVNVSGIKHFGKQGSGCFTIESGHALAWKKINDSHAQRQLAVLRMLVRLRGSCRSVAFAFRENQLCCQN